RQEVAGLGAGKRPSAQQTCPTSPATTTIPRGGGLPTRTSDVLTMLARTRPNCEMGVANAGVVVSACKRECRRAGGRVRDGGGGVPMTEHAVVIAGGGPTGLMLAGELALAEIDVVVVERRDSQDLNGSRAGGLHSRTIKMLDQRGIADRFLSQGQVAQVAG